MGFIHLGHELAVFLTHPEKYISEILTLAKLVILDSCTRISSERAQSLLFFIPLGVCGYIPNNFVFREQNFLRCFLENSTLNFSPHSYFKLQVCPLWNQWQNSPWHQGRAGLSQLTALLWAAPAVMQRMNTRRVVSLEWRVPKLDRSAPASGHHLAEVTVLSLALCQL